MWLWTSMWKIPNFGSLVDLSATGKAQKRQNVFCRFADAVICKQIYHWFIRTKPGNVIPPNELRSVIYSSVMSSGLTITIGSPQAWDIVEAQGISSTLVVHKQSCVKLVIEFSKNYASATTWSLERLSNMYTTKLYLMQRLLYSN